MEKRRPSFDLEAFKLICGDARRLQMTLSAAATAAQLGFQPEAVAALVRSMRPPMFYKSMTSYANPRQWQDVYHVPTAGGLVVYLKFTDDVVSKFVVLSFKEK